MVLISLLMVIVAAWGYLFYQHQQMTIQPKSAMAMLPASATQWKLSDFLLIYAMWAVMMAAMMLPSALPVIIAFTKIVDKRRLKAPIATIYVFVSGYFLVWLLFSVLLTLAQWRLHALFLLTPMMNPQNSRFAAGIFFTAGVYQWLPLKRTCLKHCQSPLGFLLNQWQDGIGGAFNMGFRHGLHCVGCCWAQMLIMFAVGVMNLAAMALITAVVLVEKQGAVSNKLITGGISILFLLWAAALLLKSSI